MEFTITFDEKEANLILAGLAELPAKLSIDLILKVKNECEKIIRSKEEK